MRVLRSEFFIRRDFEFYDSGIIALCGERLFCVYDLLRRFVWRSEGEGIPTLRELVKSGKLVACISQTKLAEMVGIDRARINECIRLMEQVGWLQRVEFTAGGAKGYLLGEVLSDQFGGRHEIFWADAWMKAAWDALEDADTLATGNSNPEIHKQPMSWRIATLQAWILKQPGGSALLKQESPLCAYSTPPCAPTAHPPADPVRLQHIEIDNPTGLIKVENGESGPAAPRRAEKLPEKAPLSEPEAPSSGIEQNPSERTTRGNPVNAAKISSAYVDALDPAEIPGVNFGAVSAQGTRALEAAREVLVKGALEKETRLATLGGSVVPLGIRAFLHKAESVWKSGMERVVPGAVVAAWGPKDRGIIRAMVDKYGEGVVLLGLAHVLEEWESYSQRLFGGKSSIPTLGFVQRFHEMVFVEAQQVAPAKEVLAEYAAWFKANPGKLTPPSELVARYKTAKAVMDRFQPAAQKTR